MSYPVSTSLSGPYTVHHGPAANFSAFDGRDIDVVSGRHIVSRKQLLSLTSHFLSSCNHSFNPTRVRSRRQQVRNVSTTKRGRKQQAFARVHEAS